MSMTESNNNSFSRRQRLLEKRHFDAVFKTGRRSADRFFTVLYDSTDFGYARLGLALAKKKVPLATRRNRLKRLIRESFRQVHRDLAGLDIVILARPEADAAANQEIFLSLEGHWRRLARAAAH
jgi:ribonuclease P protein component